MGTNRSTPPCDRNVLGPQGRVPQGGKREVLESDGLPQGPGRPATVLPRAQAQPGWAWSRAQGAGRPTRSGAHAPYDLDALRPAQASERLDTPTSARLRGMGVAGLGPSVEARHGASLEHRPYAEGTVC